MFKIRFTLGDWSDSGHGKKETYHMKSNYSAKEINEVLLKYENETGSNISSWCMDDGDTIIHSYDTNSLVTMGIVSSSEIINGEYDCENALGYIDLISRIIKYYIPDFEWDYESYEDEETLYIDKGGYGLW